MMKTALAIAVPCGAILTAFMWRLSELLSPDAIGMAIGMTLGVLAGIPTLALVTLARRRDEEDYDDRDYLDAPVVYADEVTPYTHLARRVMQLPELPNRQAEIDQLRAVLDYIEAKKVTL